MNLKTKLFFLFILSILLSLNNAYALEVDIHRSCSILGRYTYDSKNIDDVEVYLYRIASSDSFANYTYLDEFSSFSKDINQLSTSQWIRYANEISDYIDQHSISYFKKTKVLNGSFQFSDLDVGLYIIRYSDKEDDQYVYKTDVSLIGLPTHDAVDNTYQYDVSMNAKVFGEKKVGDNPLTFDNIKIYLILFGLSILGLILLIVLLKRKGDKK